ncbi:uncharacterized protein LOC142331725 isoform X2 [Lycorma delicatula]
MLFDPLVKLEENEHSYLVECNKINELFKLNESYSALISEFEIIFNPMMKGMEHLSNKPKEMEAIFFIGMSGSGKSTIVNVLGRDNFKIHSKKMMKQHQEDEEEEEEEEEDEDDEEVKEPVKEEDENEGSSKFIIVDDFNKIGIETTVSKTLYPEILRDNETGYILVDNPGFADTRSPIHEIITLYSIRKVLQHINNIKIVIVVTHSSIEIGKYRKNFVQLLKYVTEFLHNTDKYKKSIFLIGTKTENTVYLKKGSYKLISDKKLIKDVASFFKSIKTDLVKGNVMNITADGNNLFKDNALKVIDSLLEDPSKGSYHRIKLFRTPMEEGQIAKMPFLQNERQDIRNMLFTKDYFTETDIEDFGFALSAEAKIYLGSLFKSFNIYITEVSRLITMYIINHYEKLIDLVSIDDGLKMFVNFKKEFKILTAEIGSSKSGTHFVTIINNYSEKNKLKINCLNSFRTILKFDKILSGIGDINNGVIAKYDPLSWNATMNIAYDIIEYKIEQYNFLNEVIEILSLYENQLLRNSLLQSLTKNNSEEFDINIFLKNNSFKMDYNNLKIDNTLNKKFNLIINVILKHTIEYECWYETLTIKSYNILVSELNEALINCHTAKKIVILAQNILFIDKNLTDDYFKGKDLIMIAPIWNVIGKKMISVSGANGQNPVSRAETGIIGMDGYDGGNSGNFIGIGMKFNNGINLLIKANGGNGGKGQDGGHGADGINGIDGFYPTEKLDDRVLITLVYNSNVKVHVRKGSSGTAGGNSGSGGKGGSGGKRGSIIIYNTEQKSNEISLETNDGKAGENGSQGIPGKGGKMGCDLVTTDKVRFVGFIPVYASSPEESTNCDRFNPDGFVLQNNKNYYVKLDNAKKLVCVTVLDYEKYFRDALNYLVKNSDILSFINQINKIKNKQFCY